MQHLNILNPIREMQAVLLRNGCHSLHGRELELWIMALYKPYDVFSSTVDISGLATDSSHCSLHT